NGHTSSLQNPPPQFFMTSGTTATGYQVRLIISDSAGCYDTASRLIRSVPNCYIAVPNAFTPNGDGLNDYLYPLNAYRATDLTFKVYNRFGQLMFQTHDWTQKWDGLVRGEPQPMGVYVWVLQYTDEKNKKVFLKGFTTLIR
ncbi:MAG TPA: gliding motility-associated C-terminal domain-containing protein, partial [Chitinophagaceae bacterium]|nr:gliding motility-associated C-terminal domain-containing protein [Chitinophagaceae bacterium]